MNDEDGRVTPEELNSSLRNEYTSVERSWRFFVGLRFSVLAFAAPLLSVLAGFYQYALTHKRELEDLGYMGLWVIPLFGVISLVGIYLIEERTRSLYLACATRGQVIENKLGAGDEGLFHKMWEAPLPFGFVRYTWVLRGLYLAITAIWLYLLWRGISQYL